MNSKDFDGIVEKQLETIRTMLVSKGKEYASSVDRLHNFKRAGQIANITPAEALQGFLLKHIVSYCDIIDKVKNNECINAIKFEDVFNDYVNYIILQKAVIIETGLVGQDEKREK